MNCKLCNIPHIDNYESNDVPISKEMRIHCLNGDVITYCLCYPSCYKLYCDSMVVCHFCKNGYQIKRGTKGELQFIRMHGIGDNKSYFCDNSCYNLYCNRNIHKQSRVKHITDNDGFTKIVRNYKYNIKHGSRHRQRKQTKFNYIQIDKKLKQKQQVVEENKNVETINMFNQLNIDE
jgi:acyl-CoA-binding protein